MKTRHCQHPRVRIHEDVRTEAVFEFDCGRIVNDYNREHGPTGIVFVSCPDCGYGRRFRDESRMPNWVRGLYRRVKHD